MDKALFYLQISMMIQMLIQIMLFLLSKTQNYKSPLQLYQHEIIKNQQNFLAKDLKDQYTGMNIKKKKTIKIRQMNIDTLSNQILLELIGCLFQFIQIKVTMLKDLKLEYITNQKTLLITITSSPVEKTFISK